MIPSTPRTAPDSRAGTDRAVAFLIFTTLYIIYLLTLNGVFRTVDELQMYTTAESLAQRGSLDTPQILFSTYHNPVGFIEPGQAVLAVPLYALAQQFSTVNNIQAVMLLSPLVTALTAAVLYRIGRALGYSGGACITLSFGFGLATIAWPYARTFLREPLLGLILALAVLAYITFRNTRQTRWIGALLGLLLASIAVKIAAVAAAPFLLIPAIADLSRFHPRHKRAIISVSIAFTLIVIGLALLIALARYTFSFERVFGFLGGVSFSGAVTALYGMFLSPGKGIVFYAPIVLVAWWGLVSARRHRALFIWIAALAPLATVFAYSGYSAWYGGQVWGPRFLVPVVPLMILPLAERIGKRSTWILLAASFILQIGPATGDWAIGHRPLNQISRPFETTVGLDPAYWYLSPPFNQLRLWTSERADLLWAHPMAQTEFRLDSILPLGLIVVLVLSIVLLRRAARAQVHPRAEWAALALCVAATALLLYRGWNDTPDTLGMSLEEARTVATSRHPSGQTFVTVSNDFRIYYMLGLMKGTYRHFWYSPGQHDHFDELASAHRAWPLTLTIDRAHMPSDQSGNDLRDWLNLNAYQYGGGFVGGYERMEYVWEPEPDRGQPVSATFGNALAVESVGFGGEEFAPGGVIPIQIVLRKKAALPDPLALTVRISDGRGTVIGGHNGPIQFGALRLSDWPIGTSATDRRGFPIPPDAPAGTYTVLIGFETTEGFLKTDSGEEFAPIGQVRIGP